MYQSLNVLLYCNEVIKKLNKRLDFLKSCSQKKQPDPQIEGLILNTLLMYSELLYYIWALNQQALDYMHVRGEPISGLPYYATKLKHYRE